MKVSDLLEGSSRKFKKVKTSNPKWTAYVSTKLYRDSYPFEAVAVMYDGKIVAFGESDYHEPDVMLFMKGGKRISTRNIDKALKKVTSKTEMDFGDVPAKFTKAWSDFGSFKGIWI